MRGKPWEGPAQAPLDLFDLRERCARDGHKGQVGLRKVLPRRVEVIGHEGAPLADALGAWHEHEMLDRELLAALAASIDPEVLRTHSTWSSLAHGKRRRSARKASSARVVAFSLASSAMREASHFLARHDLAWRQRAAHLSPVAGLP